MAIAGTALSCALIPGPSAICLAAPAGSPPASAPDSGPGADRLDLDELLHRLGERAGDYQTVALRYVCVETIHDSEDPKSDKRYDYMYVEVEPQRYRPYRQKHSNRPVAGSEVLLGMNFPDSYSWTLMFNRQRQHLFKFRYIGREWFSLRQAHVLAFDAPLPFTSGRMIYEWSGKVWVDVENGNLLKIEATPGNQEERLKTELAAYRRSPRFLIFPMGHKPEGARYTITFLNQFHGLSLPDQADYLVFALDLEGNEEWGGLTTLRYNAYQFFNIDAREIMRNPVPR